MRIQALYQMLKIQDLPIDNRYKILDLLCLPDYIRLMKMVSFNASCFQSNKFTIVVHNSYCLRAKKCKSEITRFGFPRPVTNIILLILKNLIVSIAGRKSLKAKNRLSSM